jgi:hypothetical protein
MALEPNNSRQITTGYNFHERVIINIFLSEIKHALKNCIGNTI